jgi:hypothetical protein
LAIEPNFKIDKKGKTYIQLSLYRYGSPNEDSVMTINLYFKDIPDTVTYYLNIPFLKPGVRSVYIDAHPKPIIKIPLEKYRIIHDPIYSITEIVFPDKE